MIPTMDDVIKEIERLEQEQPDGFSARELAASTGHSYQWCLRKISLMIEKGQVIYNGRRKTLDISNKVAYIPVYKMKGNDNE